MRVVDPNTLAVQAARGLGGKSWGQQHSQDSPRIASRPSQIISGVITKAANGSAHRMCQRALTPNPTRAINEKNAHNDDCAASALNAALLVAEESLRFSLASHGMIRRAAIKTPIPRYVGFGSA